MHGHAITQKKSKAAETQQKKVKKGYCKIGYEFGYEYVK